MSPASNHTTVLLEEAVAALAIRPDGLYIDGTFGRGGHSRLILKQLSEKGQLLAIDKDPQAIEYAQANFAIDANFQIHSASFSDLPELLTAAGQLGQVDGLLLDLGVSSPQLDQAERGFSFMRDGPLDMRMDNRNGPSAAQWLATAEMTEIAQILKDYGEERFAKRIARAIVEQREQRAVTTTAQLAQIIKDAHPAWDKHKHPATRSFQAIRIFINRELADLELLLDSVLDILKIGGRLVVISFHSLEDRMVKRFIQKQSRGDDFPPDLPVRHDQLNQRIKKIGGFTKVSAQEQGDNVRARSAVMRVAEKLA